MPNISAKELANIFEKCEANKITPKMIAEKSGKTPRYVRMVFDPNDKRYSEDVVSAAKQLLVDESIAGLNHAVKKHNSILQVL